MRTIKGPAIFLAQFMGDKPPFDTLEGICTWMASLGYKGVQIPSWYARCIDLRNNAAEAEVHFEDGSHTAAPIVIGAVGIHRQREHDGAGAMTQAGDPAAPCWGLSGFYASVIRAGTIRVGDAIGLAE